MWVGGAGCHRLSLGYCHLAALCDDIPSTHPCSPDLTQYEMRTTYLFYAFRTLAVVWGAAQLFEPTQQCQPKPKCSILLWHFGTVGETPMYRKHAYENFGCRCSVYCTATQEMRNGVVQDSKRPAPKQESEQPGTECPLFLFVGAIAAAAGVGSAMTMVFLVIVGGDCRCCHHFQLVFYIVLHKIDTPSMVNIPVLPHRLPSRDRCHGNRRPTAKKLGGGSRNRGRSEGVVKETLEVRKYMWKIFIYLAVTA